MVNDRWAYVPFLQQTESLVSKPQAGQLVMRKSLVVLLFSMAVLGCPSVALAQTNTTPGLYLPAISFARRSRQPPTPTACRSSFLRGLYGKKAAFDLTKSAP